MAQANLPIQFWGDALLTATYILNRVPSKLVSSTPYELWSQRKPNLNELHPWGCAAYVHDTSHQFGKLGPRGKKCIFIRYSHHSKGFDFIGEGSDGRITEIESRDVTFIEDYFPIKGTVDRSSHLLELETDQEANPIEWGPLIRIKIQVGVRNQQNLYPKIPTTDVAKLLQYSGSRVERKDGFSS